MYEDFEGVGMKKIRSYRGLGFRVQRLGPLDLPRLCFWSCSFLPFGAYDWGWWSPHKNAIERAGWLGVAPCM